MAAWLSIVGIGEDGMAGLSAAARQVVERAEVIIGGQRHHCLSDTVTAERLSWPHPFDALIDELRARRGRRLVVLATGDPLWFSVGARIGRVIPPDQIAYFPALSAFQWAAARLGWSLADTETLTAHGRAAEQVIPCFWPGARLLILTAGAETPGQIARLLDARGYGGSAMTVFGSLGGPAETRHDGTAGAWAAHDPTGNLPAFNTLAVHCAGGSTRPLSRLPGLQDDAFHHDGMLTKQAVRSLTLANLMPARGQVLWDIGTGCGSVAIEWMRAAPDALAVGLDPDAKRLDLARGQCPGSGGAAARADPGPRTGRAGAHRGTSGAPYRSASTPCRIHWRRAVRGPGPALLAGSALGRASGRQCGDTGTRGGALPAASRTGRTADPHRRSACPAGRPADRLAPGNAGHPMGGGQMSGTLYGIGLGPGDPELMTLKAYRLIGAAGVIAYPAPDTGDSLARSIATGAIPPGAVEIPMVVPMRAQRFPAQQIYADAAKTIDGHLRAGRDVAVLCEGDPLFYGSFMYLFVRLAERHRVEIVPGVSSLGACAAALGRPLVARNDALAILPGPLPDQALRPRIDAAETVALMKVGRHLPRLRALIAAMGLTGAAGYVERATMPAERVMPLADAPDQAPYFSMILITKGDDPWLTPPR